MIDGFSFKQQSTNSRAKQYDVNYIAEWAAECVFMRSI
jgi:hypothetical protein